MWKNHSVSPPTPVSDYLEWVSCSLLRRKRRRKHTSRDRKKPGMTIQVGMLKGVMVKVAMMENVPEKKAEEEGE